MSTLKKPFKTPFMKVPLVPVARGATPLDDEIEEFAEPSPGPEADLDENEHLGISGEVDTSEDFVAQADCESCWRKFVCTA